jgi:glycosyltransferase EpsD
MLKTFKIAKKCDVINAHWVLSGLVSIPVKLIYGKPIVLTEHGGSLRGLPKWLNKLVLRRMDMVTSAHYDMIKSIEGMGINNVVDVKNFLNEEKFTKKHNKKSIKNKLKIKEKHVVTFIGRFEELKDPLTFVEAVSYAATKLNNVKFVMVGDGHLKEDIEKKFKSLGLEKYLLLSDPTRDVDEFLAISDVFIACSATENCFSTTILEAMLSKVPCIITKAGMTKKFFAHKKDAYLVEKKNPKALGDAIIKMLGEPKLRKNLSENGLEFLERYGFRNKVIRQKIMKTLKTVSRT